MGETWPDEIECPTCEERLGYYDVKDFARSGTFEKYNTIVQDA